MPYLIDTNALSELRRPRPNAGVQAWFEQIDSRDIYLSVLTLGEIRRGIEQLRPRQPARAAALDEWLEKLSGAYAPRTIGIDREVADRWGEIDATAHVPEADGLLAATALVRDWTLVTRNVADFERTGVRTLNPFS